MLSTSQIQNAYIMRETLQETKVNGTHHLFHYPYPNPTGMAEYVCLHKSRSLTEAFDLQSLSAYVQQESLNLWTVTDNFYDISRIW